MPGRSWVQLKRPRRNSGGAADAVAEPLARATGVVVIAVYGPAPEVAHSRSPTGLVCHADAGLPVQVVTEDRIVSAHEVLARTFSETASGLPTPASNWVTLGCGSVRVPVGLVRRATVLIVIVIAVAAVPPAWHVLMLFSVQFT